MVLLHAGWLFRYFILKSSFHIFLVKNRTKYDDDKLMFCNISAVHNLLSTTSRCRCCNSRNCQCHLSTTDCPRVHSHLQLSNHLCGTRKIGRYCVMSRLYKKSNQYLSVKSVVIFIFLT